MGKTNIKNKDLNVKRSNAIVAFLKKRTNIKKHPICVKVGYDSSNLQKCLAIENRHIPERHLSDFERALKLYGFEPYTES